MTLTVTNHERSVSMVLIRKRFVKMLKFLLKATERQIKTLEINTLI